MDRSVSSQLTPCVFAFLLAIAPARGAEPQSDPFARIQTHNLSNGMAVYLVPDQKSKNAMIRMDVKVGFNAEKGENVGVSHLLEHVLFKDKKLGDDSSYLDLVVENGGEINAHVTDRETSYYITVPSERLSWAIGIFSKLLIHPSFDPELMERAKSAISLEIGEPSPLSDLLGFPLREWAASLLRTPTFYESEFNVEFPDYGHDEEALSTERLTLAQVKDHFQDYYRPDNMTLFATGNFDPRQVLNQLEISFGALIKRKGKSYEIPEAEIEENPFRYNQLALFDNPRISLGVKLWEPSARQILALDLYLGWLKHQLMKTLRNRQGEAYSIDNEIYSYKQFGFATLSFQTTRKNYRRNIKLIRDRIQSETQAKGLSDETIREAVNLYLKQYHLVEADSHSLMGLADLYHYYRSTFELNQSPYQLVTELSPGDIRGLIQDTFRENRRIEDLSVPPLLFRYDLILLLAMGLVASILLSRKVFFRRTDLSHYDRSEPVKTSPYHLNEFAFILLRLGIIAFALTVIIPKTLFHFDFYRASVFFNTYLYLLSVFMTIPFCFAWITSRAPKQIELNKKELTIRFFILRDRTYKLKDLDSISRVPQWVALTKSIFRPKSCFYSLSHFKRDCVRLRFKDGFTYYLPFQDTAFVEKEIRSRAASSSHSKKAA